MFLPWVPGDRDGSHGSSLLHPVLQSPGTLQWSCLEKRRGGLTGHGLVAVSVAVITTMTLSILGGKGLVGLPLPGHSP